MKVCWFVSLVSTQLSRQIDLSDSQTDKKYKDVENRAGIWLNDSRFGL